MPISAGLDNPGPLVTPLASHEEGGPRDTAITREQLNAKDNCLAWLIGGATCCELAGQPDFATGLDARPQGGMNSAGRGRDPTDCGLLEKLGISEYARLFGEPLL